VHAMPEGSVFFANEPILRVTAPLPQAQFVESRLINILHFQSLVAAKAARIYLKRILENGNKPFDGAWMQQTFDDYWAYAQFVTGWTNAMLQPPPPHVINILVAAQSKPKVGKAFVNGFDDPRTFFPWLADPGEAEKFIAAA